MTTKRYKIDKNKPFWYDKALQQSKQRKRKAERIYKKKPNEENRDKFVEQRNQYNKDLKNTRSKYFNKRIEDCNSNPKDMFKTLSKLTGRKTTKKFLTFDEKPVVAEKMAQYYIDKIDKIRESIKRKDSTIVCQNSNKSHEIFGNFNVIDLETLKATVSQMKKKTCTLDPAPTSLLTKFLNLLFPILLHIINFIITYSYFPDNLKEAIMTPILKDSNISSDELSNWRPICDLPFLAKVVEKILLNQIEQHLNRNELYGKYQSAYRRFHSCETAVTKICSDIQLDIYKKKYVLFIMLDSSSAFDTVDHDRLINKLKTQ